MTLSKKQPRRIGKSKYATLSSTEIRAEITSAFKKSGIPYTEFPFATMSVYSVGEIKLQFRIHCKMTIERKFQAVCFVSSQCGYGSWSNCEFRPTIEEALADIKPFLTTMFKDLLELQLGV